MTRKKDIAERLRRIADALDPQPEPEAPPAPLVFAWPTYPTFSRYQCAVCGQWINPNNAGHYHWTCAGNTVPWPGSTITVAAS